MLEFALFTVFVSLGHGQVMPSLPDPRIIIVGPTGSGKSSLANALLGCDPRAPSGTCMFEVCTGMDSCTKATTYGFGPWLGKGHSFTIVDTPGFGDTAGEDEVLMEEMMSTLSGTINHADTIMLLLKGDASAFNESLIKMIKRMTIMFGNDWWDFAVIGVSFWSYSQEAIDHREEECTNYPDSCKDEAWFIRETNAQLRDKFDQDRNFTYCFTDSYSQTAGHIDDPTEQAHWTEETGKLWEETTNRTSEFSFRTIDDILEENAAQKEQIRWLNDVITNNISQLNNLIQVLNNTQISHGENIKDNAQGIETNIQNIDTNSMVANKGINENKNSIDENMSSIEQNRISIDENTIDISTNQANITRNSNDIASNEGYINDNRNNIASNKGDINRNNNDIASNKGDINRNDNDIASSKGDIKVNSNNIARLSIRGAQCGYRQSWQSGSTINYERLLLDTGRGSLDISSGEWRAEEKGLFQVSWSLRNSLEDGKDNRIYLYKNGAQLPESLHASWTYGADIAEQGGRSTLLQLNVNDRLHLGTTGFTGGAADIQFCVNLLSAD